MSKAPLPVDYQGDGGRDHMLKLERERLREREAKLGKLESLRYGMPFSSQV